MRFLLAGLLVALGASAKADPVDADAAAELRLFLSTTAADYRVLDFRVLDREVVGPVRRYIRYRARIEFPYALSPEGRALLAHENVEVVQGKINELSSAKLVVELHREAKFVHTQHGWFVQVGTTRYPLDHRM